MAVSSGMGAATKTLYETDFVEWSKRTAELLRAGCFEEADLEHAAEEILAAFHHRRPPRDRIPILPVSAVSPRKICNKSIAAPFATLFSKPASPRIAAL